MCWVRSLLAKKMGKTRVIAETGAGQHGVATATAAALLDMECEIFMGKEDTDRQALNVYRMELLGAKVHPVTTGTHGPERRGKRDDAGVVQPGGRYSSMSWDLSWDPIRFP